MADINHLGRGFDAPALHVQRQRESYMRQPEIASPGVRDIE